MKKTTIKTKAPTATVSAVRALLREAERGGEVPTNQADDAALLKAARSAQLEGNGFTEMFDTVAAVSGTVEVLYQMVQRTGDVAKDVNWGSVGDLLGDARRRLGGVYSGLGMLEQYERQVEEEAEDARIDAKAARIIAAREARGEFAIGGAQ